MGNAAIPFLLALALPPQSSGGEALLSEFRAIEAERSRALKVADVPRSSASMPRTSSASRLRGRFSAKESSSRTCGKGDRRS